MKLERWAVVQGEVDPYQAPELACKYLTGEVYGKPNFSEGHYVRTSQLLFVKEGFAFTKSGSVYTLGEVHPEYEKMYPNARNRIMENFI
jgi:hypothetical protein